MHNNNKEIGKRIKYARTELNNNLSLQDVADKTGVARSTVQRYEAGKIDKIKAPVLESFARALRVNPVWLMGHDAPIQESIDDRALRQEAVEGLVFGMESRQIEKAMSKALDADDISNETWNRFIASAYKVRNTIVNSRRFSSVYIGKQEAILALKEICNQTGIDWRKYDDDAFRGVLSNEVFKEFLSRNLDLQQEAIEISKEFTPVAAHNDSENTPEEVTKMQEDIDEL